MSNRISKNIALEILLDFLFWPIWWYSAGFLKVLTSAFGQVVYQYEYLGLGVWIKNIFTPMYGMYDWESRIISFLVRIAQIFVRGILLILWTFFILCGVIIWLVLPIFIVFQIYSIIIVI